MELPRLPVLLVGAAALTGCPNLFGTAEQEAAKSAPSGCHYSGGGKGEPILVCDEPQQTSSLPAE